MTAGRKQNPSWLTPGLFLGVLSLSLLSLGMAACDSRNTAPPEASTDDRPPVEVSATVDRAVATTGDVLTYTVELDYDPNYQVLLPEPGANIAGFRILDLGSEPTREERGRVIEGHWYRLRADLVGSYVLPPLTVRYRPMSHQEATLPEQESSLLQEAEESSADADWGEQEEFRTVQTSEIFVEVESVLPTDGEVADIRDIKPIAKVEEPISWTWWVGGGVALLLLSVLGLWWWRRQQAARPAPPPRPAHEVAFAALNDLRGTDFEDPEAVHRFYFRLSEILRTYVEARFGLNATDLTTEEILAQLEDGEHFLPKSDVLRRFLLTTDQVKFADHRPDEAEIQAAYEDALGYVEATRPAEPTTDTAAASSDGQTKQEAAA